MKASCKKRAAANNPLIPRHYSALSALMVNTQNPQNRPELLNHFNHLKTNFGCSGKLLDKKQTAFPMHLPKHRKKKTQDPALSASPFIHHPIIVLGGDFFPPHSQYIHHGRSHSRENCGESEQIF